MSLSITYSHDLVLNFKSLSLLHHNQFHLIRLGNQFVCHTPTDQGCNKIRIYTETDQIGKRYFQLLWMIVQNFEEMVFQTQESLIEFKSSHKSLT